MARRRKGKPTWQNRYHKKPENTPDELFDKWFENEMKISEGMQKKIDHIEKCKEHAEKLRNNDPDAILEKFIFGKGGY